MMSGWFMHLLSIPCKHRQFPSGPQLICDARQECSDLGAFSYSNLHTGKLSHIMDAHKYSHSDKTMHSDSQSFLISTFSPNAHIRKHTGVHNEPPSSVWIRPNKQVDCLWSSSYLLWPWLTVVCSECSDAWEGWIIGLCRHTFCEQVNTINKLSSLHTTGLPTESLIWIVFKVSSCIHYHLNDAKLHFKLRPPYRFKLTLLIPAHVFSDNVFT